MGAALGAAAITKFNSLPIAVLLVILATAPSIRVTVSNLKSKPAPVLTPDLLSVGRRSLGNGAVSASDATGFGESGQGRRHVSVDLRMLMDGALAVAGFIAVSGWWFVRNKQLYGQFLATKTSEHYLQAFYLHPVPWSFHIVFNTLPQTLLTNTWYTQLDEYLPLSTDKALGDMALACLVAGGYFIFTTPTRRSHRPPILSSGALVGSIVAGIAAVLITIQATSIGNTRVAFVGLTGFAVVEVIGISRLAGRINPRLELAGLVVWPAVLLALDLYVLVHFLIPLGGL
jgi:hypothetical protein